MKARRKKWIIIVIVVVVILLSIIGFLWINKEKLITEKDVNEIIVSTYGVSPSTVSLDNAKNIYNVEIERSTGKYQVNVDAISGSILNLSNLTPESNSTHVEENELLSEEEAKLIIQEQEQTLPSSIQETQKGKEKYFSYQISGKQEIFLINRVTKDITISEVIQQDNVLISEAEAKQIALSEVDGTIHEIDLEEEDNQTYYEVELEDSNNREVKVQINAYTGEVNAISLDDD